MNVYLDLNLVKTSEEREEGSKARLMGGGVAARVKYIKTVDMHVCPPRGADGCTPRFPEKKHGQASASSDCDPWDGDGKRKQTVVQRQDQGCLSWVGWVSRVEIRGTFRQATAGGKRTGVPPGKFWG
jgi:hypothetical protein